MPTEPKETVKDFIDEAGREAADRISESFDLPQPGPRVEAVALDRKNMKPVTWLWPGTYPARETLHVRWRPRTREINGGF